MAVVLQSLPFHPSPRDDSEDDHMSRSSASEAAAALESNENNEIQLLHESTSTSQQCLIESDDDVPSLNSIDLEMDAILQEENGDDDESDSYGGLVNLGNTCYMNAAVQMLASVEPFIDSIRERECNSSLRTALLELMSRLRDGETVRPDGFKRVIDERSPLFVGFDQQDSHEFLTTLLDLIDTDYTKKADEEQQDESMETASVSSPLNESMETASDDADDETDTRDESSDKQSPLKRVRQDESYRDIVLPPYLKPRRSFSQLDVKGIDSLLHGDNFSSTQRDPFPFQPQQPRCKLIGGRMNTAKADLTAFVSDKMLEDGPPSPARMDRSIDESVASSAASDDDTDESSTPVTDFFNATVRVRLTCDSCKYSRTHKETFSFLSLEIGPDSGSVEDGLRRFFAPEKRELKCEKCFAESATQSMEIIHLPKLLLLHFKRFLVDVSHDYSSVSYRKNRSSVAFDDTLTLDDHGVLSEFLAADCRAQGTYQIKSVVNHIGSSASCGHYTCDSHRSRQQWFRFNDAFVSRIQPQQALEGSQRTAYMVLYELE